MNEAIIHKIMVKAVSGALVGVVTFTVIGHTVHLTSDPRTELEAVLPTLPDEGPHRSTEGTTRVLDLNAPAARLGEGLTFTDRDGVAIRLYFA